MLNFILLMIVPFIIAVAVLLIFKKAVTVWEFLGQLGMTAAFIGICLAIAYNARTTDVEVWNGQVTQRETHHVSCSHSYQCHCHEVSSGSGKNRTTHEECDTCYEHSYDVDWTVHASTGESLNIEREDRQGLVEPKRWDEAYPGQPYSSEHSFTNYILANPDSVLLGTKGDVEKFKNMLPNYPATIYDYYKHDPVINMGVPNVDMKTWNWLVQEQNKVLGTAKQANVIVILVPTDDASYMLALKDKWVGGKKNDIDVVIGSTDGHKIEFADVMSWTTNADFKVDLKNQIQDIGNLDRKDDIVKAIGGTTQAKFERMHMKSMKYLMRSFQPSGASMMWSFILSILLNIGYSIWAVKNNITD
jgi:hypothetical protein